MSETPRGTLVFRTTDVARPYADDVARIVRVCAEQGWIISPSDALAAWEEYSEGMAAGWISMGPDDSEADDYVYRTVRCYTDEAQS